jgi:hypothetical protein
MTWGTNLTRPVADTFAAIPATVERLLTGAPGGLPQGLLGDAAPERADRVGVVLLDAFGMRFVERHADHPLLRRLHVAPLASQFPSTTTAHVTTMHTGTPVGAHGLYEWNVYEPALGAVITPILYTRAGEYTPDGLRGSGVAIGDILGGTTFYERLSEAGVRSVVLQPAAFSPSTYDSVATRGAELRPYPAIADGAAGLVEALQEPGYAYLYWHEIDMTGHLHGPDSPEFDAACLAALGALDAALADAGPEALVLFTADHGQVAVDAARVDYLDDVMPEVGHYLAHGPAGSARDLFLHAQPGLAAELVGELRERLDGRADVVQVAELEAAGLFGDVGPRLRARLADVCVLPSAGRMAWLRSHASVEQRFRGHHGGLHPAECETWLGTMVRA